VAERGPDVVVHRTPELLAAAVAARLIVRLVDAQAARGSASFVATGGGVGTATLAAVADSPARDAVDWRRVDIWWGDERFLPSGDPERNETQAREALLDRLRLEPGRVHAMPASDGAFGDDVDAAARAYADDLAAATTPTDHFPVPEFDVVLLGVGPDAHVASLFPSHPATYEAERPVIGVRGSPKPPPVRITLTFPALCRGQEVWLLAAGEGKAGAVALALSSAGEIQVPATGVRGTRRTAWLLDRAAATGVPPGLARPGSP
jgi:6-phosphogluconolactonase